MSMDGAAVENIARLAEKGTEIQTIELGEDVYSTQTLYRVREKEDAPSPIKIGTLQGVVEYVNHSIDLQEGVKGKQLHVIVESHKCVKVSTSLFGEQMQRADYAECEARGLSERLPINQYIPLERAIVFLKTHFVPTDESEKMVQFISSVKVKSSVKVEDNGMSTMVETKKGIARTAAEELPNYLTLKPYRTFAEVDQPESTYVVRASADSGEVEIAFYASDSSEWMVEATKNVAEYLKANIKRDNTIIIS